MLDCLAGLLAAVADGAQSVVAEDSVHLGVAQHGDLGVITGGIGCALGAGEVVAADENGDMSCVLGEEHGLLCCGKAAADDEHILAGEELAVAGGAVGYAAAAEIFFSGESHHAGMCAGGQQHAEALELTPVGVNGLYIAAHVKLVHACQHELSAEVFGLLTHGLGQLCTAGAANAGVVYNLMGNGDLAAELFLFNNQYAVFCSCKIYCGSKPRGAAADNDNVI